MLQESPPSPPASSFRPMIYVIWFWRRVLLRAYLVRRSATWKAYRVQYSNIFFSFPKPNNNGDLLVPIAAPLCISVSPNWSWYRYRYIYMYISFVHVLTRRVQIHTRDRQHRSRWWFFFASTPFPIGSLIFSTRRNWEGMAQQEQHSSSPWYFSLSQHATAPPHVILPRPDIFWLVPVWLVGWEVTWRCGN